MFKFYNTSTNSWNPRSLPSITPDFSLHQTYLDGGLGMNIREAWKKGATGVGVTIHHLEEAIHEDHEDLVETNLEVIGYYDEMSHYFADRGTASAGLLVGKDNKLGVKGICYNSRLKIHTPTSSYRGISHMVQAGDIVSTSLEWINHNYTISDNTIEYLKKCRDRGAVIALAAGDRSQNLNKIKDTLEELDVIVVGSCKAKTGLRSDASSYNAPKMLNSWGEKVTSTGYMGDLQNKKGCNRDYTSTYGGTFSAAALVAGALALIQSYYMKKFSDRVLTTRGMYDLVSSMGYTEGVEDGIGVRPNVYATLQAIDRMVEGDNNPCAGDPPVGIDFYSISSYSTRLSHDQKLKVSLDKTGILLEVMR